MSTKKLQIVTPIVTSVNDQTGDVTLPSIASIVEDSEGISIVQTSTGEKILFKTSAQQIDEDSFDQYIIDIDGIQSKIDGMDSALKAVNVDISTANTAIGELNDSVEEHTGSINNIQSSVDALDTKTQYINTGIENGKPYIKLGITNSEFELKVTNESIDFHGSADTPARIINNVLEIDKATVTNELSFGEFVWQKRKNGNMGIIWKEATS